MYFKSGISSREKRMHYIYIGQTTQKLQGKQCKDVGRYLYSKHNLRRRKTKERNFISVMLGTTRIETITNN